MPTLWHRTLAMLLLLFAAVSANSATLPNGTVDGDYIFWDADSTSWIARQPANRTQEASSEMPALGVQHIISLFGLYPSRTFNSQPFVAEIGLFAGNFAPRDWAFCNGQLLAVSSFDALFSLIGAVYGGDGRTTFALPDLRGRLAVHSGGGAGPGVPFVPLGGTIGASVHDHNP